MAKHCEYSQQLKHLKVKFEDIEKIINSLN